MTDKEKIAQLEHILKSGAFSKASTSSRLLKFLTISTIEGKDLKENTVGIELFGTSFIKEASSSRIRVNIYNLRKKLTVYYEKEGKEDSLKIEIEKGQYYTQFKINKDKVAVIDYEKRFKIIAICLGILFFSSLLTLGGILHSSKVPIWDAFF